MDQKKRATLLVIAQQQVVEQKLGVTRKVLVYRYIAIDGTQHHSKT